MIKLFEEFNKEPEVKINYYNNGQKESEEWFLNGLLHREDGPAYQQWYENGQKQVEEWFLNGFIVKMDLLINSSMKMVRKIMKYGG